MEAEKSLKSLNGKFRIASMYSKVTNKPIKFMLSPEEMAIHVTLLKRHGIKLKRLGEIVKWK